MWRDVVGLVRKDSCVLGKNGLLIFWCVANTDSLNIVCRRLRYRRPLYV